MRAILHVAVLELEHGAIEELGRVLQGEVRAFVEQRVGKLAGEALRDDQVRGVAAAGQEGRFRPEEFLDLIFELPEQRVVAGGEARRSDVQPEAPEPFADSRMNVGMAGKPGLGSRDDASPLPLGQAFRGVVQPHARLDLDEDKHAAAAGDDVDLPDRAFPALPINHPSSKVQLTLAYRSATTSAELNTNAWHVGFASGAIGAEVARTANNFTWCVRGGYGYDAQ